MLTMGRITGLLLISILSLGNGVIQSQPSPPFITKDNRQKADTQPRGTEQSPIVVEIQKSNSETDQDKKDRDEKSANDQLLTKFTGALVLVGIVQAAIFIFQLFVFGRQARRLRETVAEMKIATRATEKAAIAAEQNVEIARHEFIATHRPKIIVRRFSINKVGDDGESVDIGYEMVNTGESLATVVCSSTKLWWHTPTKPLPAIPPYAAKIVQSIPIETGMLVTVPSQPVTDFEFVAGFEEESDATTTGDRLFALGYIEYKDTIGKIRRTAFLRRYDFKAKRFDIIPHSDYEYAD
ncbi:MAG: hypothetical protein KGS09_08025 [Nitrospirae bacterium]|nr:hypothetical protein [Nitrospirota bacterium]MDE3039878.1 hypothetical protein [Nitrospirota bacterium]